MDFKEILDKMLCPKCKMNGQLKYIKEQNKLLCNSCNTIFNIINNIPIFCPNNLINEKAIDIELKHWNNNNIFNKINGEIYEDETDKSYKKIINLCNLSTNNASLGIDVGCGSGALSKRIPNGKTIGIDLSIPLLKTCHELIPIQCDAATLPFENNIFDWAIFKSSFHHIVQKKESLAEIFRCLKSQGKLIIIEPNVFHPQRNLLKNPNSLIRKLKLLGSKNLVSNETWLSFEIVKQITLDEGFINPQIYFFSPDYKKLSFLSFLQNIYSKIFSIIINEKYVASHYLLTCLKP